MDITILRNKLISAYSTDNLNKIALVLINLYQNQQYSVLQKVAEMIDEYVDIQIDEKGKGFSKLMMLYHPDKAAFHILEIEKLASAGDYDKLLEYSHILRLEKIEQIAQSLDSYEDIDYSPVYSWDADAEGFRIVNDYNDSTKTQYQKQTRNQGLSFYDAIKIRYYGHTDIEYPTYYLEDIDEFELSTSNIVDLDGIQYCIHAKTIDLSDNSICDIDLLSSLQGIEEINLSENEINEISALSNLSNLKSVFLNNNNINDLSPLFELTELELVEVLDNPVNKAHVQQLKELGVNVVC
jgi:Leucine-rich repeat (LRR) protein